MPQRKLIPYAGFDPHENDFDEPYEPIHNRFPPKKPLDGSKCKALKNSGLGMVEIGQRMANVEGRPSAYQRESVYRAIKRFERAAENNSPKKA